MRGYNYWGDYHSQNQKNNNSTLFHWFVTSYMNFVAKKYKFGHLFSIVPLYNDCPNYKINLVIVACHQRTITHQGTG